MSAKRTATIGAAAVLVLGIGATLAATQASAQNTNAAAAKAHNRGLTLT